MGGPVKLPNMEPRRPARKCVPLRRTAPPTGSRHRTIPAPVCSMCRHSKSAASTPSAIRDVDARKGILGRIAAQAARRKAAADIESHRYQDRQSCVESAATGAGGILGRDVDHSDGTGDLRRGRRSVDGGRRGKRQAAVELRDQPDLEGVPDDLHVRRQAVHRRSRRRGAFWLSRFSNSGRRRAGATFRPAKCSYSAAILSTAACRHCGTAPREARSPTRVSRALSRIRSPARERFR